MEKQDEEREKFKRTGESVAAGQATNQHLKHGTRWFSVGGPQNQRNDGETTITKEKNT